MKTTIRILAFMALTLFGMNAYSQGCNQQVRNDMNCSITVHVTWYHNSCPVLHFSTDSYCRSHHRQYRMRRVRCDLRC
jgi:hypothetical protein